MTPTGSWPSTRPGRTGYSPLHDVHVGAADRRRRDADDGLARPWCRLRPLHHAEPPRLEERHCSHRVHRILLRRASMQDDADDVPLLARVRADRWIPRPGSMNGEKSPATANSSVVFQRRDGIDLCRPAGGDRAGEQGQRAERSHRRGHRRPGRAARCRRADRGRPRSRPARTTVPTPSPAAIRRPFSRSTDATMRRRSAPSARRMPISRRRRSIP